LREREAQLVQSFLGEIGITADIELMDYPSQTERWNKGQFEISVTRWGNGTADPEGSLFVVFHSGQHGAGGNRAFYTDAEVDRLLMEGRRVSDLDERGKIYSEVTKEIMKDLPWVPLYNMYFVVGTRADLKGVDMHPTGYDAYDMLHYE